MVPVILRSRLLPLCSNTMKWAVANISTGAAKFCEDPDKAPNQKEPQQISRDSALMNPEEVEHQKKMQAYITVDDQVELPTVTGVPEAHVKSRLVRIYEPAKNSLQSGTANVGHWQIDFDLRQRWENPLMGWSSTGDPLSNMSLAFNDKEEAIRYCDRNGWKWYVQESKFKKPMRPKSYASNYSWDKRTRVSTK